MPVTQHAQGPAPGGLPLSVWELLSKSGENSSGNDGVRPDGHPCVIKCNLMRSRVTDLGTEVFKQHGKKKKSFPSTQGMGIEAGCVIQWCKNTWKKGGLFAHTGFSWPSLTSYTIEQTLQTSQLWMVWPVSWVKDGQHHFDFLGVREEDLGHNTLFPPHLPNISNRKWLSW